MQIFEVKCLNEDGDIESGGFYFHKSNAEKCKTNYDKMPRNVKYGIKHFIVEHEMSDKIGQGGKTPFIT